MSLIYNLDDKVDLKQTRRLIKMQNKEFDAADAFAKTLKAHNNTSVVDDNYPNVRFRYELALTNLLEAMKENNRFVNGNRYGLKEVK